MESTRMDIQTNGSVTINDRGDGHPSDSNVISEDEAALYDRQIRLWGVEAQKRLRSCNVLLIGLSGVGSEIIKNIVLAGIHSLTVLDSAVVTEEDSLSNLFTNHAIGTNRALASENNIKILNPMVNVNVAESNIEELLKEEGHSKLLELLKNISVVCLCSSNKHTAVKLNNLTRSLGHKVMFYWTCSWGLYGFSFNDLGKGHTFMKEEVVNSLVKCDDGEPLKKKAKTIDQEKLITEKTMDFSSLETALAVKAGKAGVGLTKRIDPVFILLHVMLDYYEQNGHVPNNREADIEILKSLRTRVADEKLALDDSVGLKLDKQSWWDKVYGEISPVSSIIGGVVGQDIIRAVSAKEMPMKNFFLFSGVECIGNIESIGK